METFTTFKKIQPIVARVYQLLGLRWLPGVALTVFALLCFFIEAGPFNSMERTAYDVFTNMREIPPANDVVVVALDDYALKRFGAAPRMATAQVIDILSGMGARTIAVELMFTGNQHNPALKEMVALTNAIGENDSFLKNKEVKGIHRKLKNAIKRADADIALQKTLKVKSRLVYPILFDLEGSGSLKPPIYISKKALSSEPVIKWQDLFTEDMGMLKNPAHRAQNPVPSASRIEYPFYGISGYVRALGHKNIKTDSDNVVRKHMLLVEFAGRLYPSLALQTALRHLNIRHSDYEGWYRNRGIEGLNFGNSLKVPSDIDFSILMSSSAPPHVYTFTEVLQGTAPPDAFRGKAVLMGDLTNNVVRYPTQDQLMLTETELNARALQDILSGAQVVRPTWAFVVELIAMLYFSILVIVVFPKYHLRIGSAVLLFSLIPLWGAQLGLYVSAGYWLNAAFATAFVLAGFLVEASREYLSLGMKSEIIAENIENNSLLGLSLQGQGMLDLAFEKFKKCPTSDPAVKENLYKLALDFERKRMATKAGTVYEHILADGPYKDAEQRMEALGTLSVKTHPGAFAPAIDGTVIHEGGVRPVLGRYEIVSELGKGAMGTVYLGLDPKINREVAIKTLMYDEVPSDDLKLFQERFFQEAKAVGKLVHPNIITIYDAGEEHDLAYMAIELLKGEDLKDYCTKDNLLPTADVLGMVADVADALSYAHDQGIVHRDIKPANIMRLEDGTVKVTDFGIARIVESSMTQTGMLLGTPSYMSPEQVEGKAITGQSDLFSLGAMLYEMLTGEKAFQGDSIATIMFNVTKSKFEPLSNISPELPDCCDEITGKLLLRSLSSRYKSGAEVANDLRKCIDKIVTK